MTLQDTGFLLTMLFLFVLLMGGAVWFEFRSINRRLEHIQSKLKGKVETDTFYSFTAQVFELREHHQLLTEHLGVELKVVHEKAYSPVNREVP